MKQQTIIKLIHLAATVCSLFFASLLCAHAAQSDITGPAGSGRFGSTVTVLMNGNFVVTDPYYDAPGPVTYVGAVYLFDGVTLALISTLTGSTAGDQVGSGGVTLLSNGNYVVSSPYWDNTRGAATWCSGTTGVGGTVSAANSLVGSTASDQVGNFGVTALNNGNYVVSSAGWNGGLGAVTWGSGETGVSDPVSEANSLVGSTVNDQVGNFGVSALNNGNYVVSSADWSGGLGAVTWGNGETGVSGPVSESNSLVGSTPTDNVGLSGVTALNNGNYVVSSGHWNNGTETGAGAVTWGSGIAGVSGAVSPANSLVGSRADDQVGNFYGVTALNNGNYVVISPFWDNDVIADAGAATWGNGTVGVSGEISTVNSLVGSTESDRVGGYFGVAALNNGNYVVCSPYWDNGEVNAVGAVTWGSGTIGVSGTVSPANSLIGSTAGDAIGYHGVTALSNGNYVVRSLFWHNGEANDAGAVTWGDGTTGINGEVSVVNSLVGSTTNDLVGIGGVTALNNGNYVVSSHQWDNGAATDAGAVTWGNGVNGVSGIISAANSLVGTAVNDFVGYYTAGSSRVIALNNGNYVVSSESWSGGLGAVTWGDGTTGLIGPVTAANSLVGSTAGDRVGLAVNPLNNGNYVVNSPVWNNGAALAVGAVTWGNGTIGISGGVSAVNSLVGSTATDQVGSSGVTALNNGNYVVNSPGWDNDAVEDAGAMTLGDGTLGTSGAIAAANSFRGGVVGGGSSMVFADDLLNSRLLIGYPSGNRISIFSFGSLPQPEIAVEQPAGTDLVDGAASIGFGSVNAGSKSAPKTFTITNSGNANITGLAITTSGSHPGDFIVGALGAITLAPGASTTFSVTFSPAGGGASSASLHIANNDSDETPFDIELTGTGIGPEIAVEQPAGTDLVDGTARIGLGSLSPGTGGTPKTFTITNRGNENLTGLAIAMDGSHADDFMVGALGATMLAPGASTTFTVTFLPVAAGTRTADLHISSNDNNEDPFDINITGFGTSPEIAVEQPVGTDLMDGATSLGFGSVSVGSSGAPKTFTITNTGTENLTGLSITIDGSHPGDFTVVSPGATTLAPGASTTFTVTFTPALNGARSAFIHIASNDADENPFDINLTGTGQTLPITMISAAQTDITGPAGSGLFGYTVTVLPNGNFIVTDPYYDAPGPIADVGAVYLFDGVTLAVISTLTGSTAGDQVGWGGVMVLDNGNFVVRSPYWNNGAATVAGAVTWSSGTAGVSGPVSAGNSLVGSTAGDQVGYGYSAALHNGNYVVNSPGWDNGALPDVGAVTWGDGTTGVSGVISDVNSLIGSTANDLIGALGVTPLSNGSYLVNSPFWDNGVVEDAGAVTWCSGTAGKTGAVSSANSLVGSQANDEVGSFGVTLLSNGNYTVSSPSWRQRDLPNGAVVLAGAVTWGSGTTGVSGAVSAVNSLVGSQRLDGVGVGGVTALNNGNYVVNSPGWHNRAVINAGAVTWGNGITGAIGLVSEVNSLVGSTANDQIGDGGVTALNNGNYVVSSPYWDLWNGGVVNAGAATWCSGTDGLSGTVSPVNSLVGSTATDQVGSSGVTALNNGNYVVNSPGWHNGAVVSAGAVTWCSGASGGNGFVSVVDDRSLVGSRADDLVGHGGVIALNNGNYVVNSPYWNNGSMTDVGAVTWCSGTTGLGDPVSVFNSLTGSTENDHIGNGGVTALNNGDYTVTSPYWDLGNGGVIDVGAATWCSGTTGKTGPISPLNSLVGTAENDRVGIGGAVALNNGNYVVSSPLWNNRVGAVTWGSGTIGVNGFVLVANSLVGSMLDDRVGNGGVTVLNNGHYVVRNWMWDNGAVVGAGAVTLGYGPLGTSGAVGPANSVLGTATSGGSSMPFAYDLLNSRLIVGYPSGNRVSLFIFVPEVAVQQPVGTELVDGVASKDFGPVNVGSSSDVKVFTIRNSGSANLTGLAITKSGSHSGDFIVGALGATTLAPGASTTFTVTFTPTSGGTRSAAIHIASGDSDENPFDINLSGTGTPFAQAVTVSGGTATAQFFGIPGYQYDVQRTTRLVEPVIWTTLNATPLSPDAVGSFSFTDIAAPTGTAYYRIVQH